MLVRDPVAAYLGALRVARGLTQVELATLAATSQASISKAEAGSVAYEAEWWNRVASALYVPDSAFQSSHTGFGSVSRFYRSRQGAGRSAIAKLHAELDLTLERLVLALESWVSHVPRATSSKIDDPLQMARDVRRELVGHNEPIDSMTELLERRGVRLVPWPLDAADFDAAGAWSSNGALLFLIGDHLPAERLRFTLAHLLWSSIVPDNDDFPNRNEEASSFAAEFLIPETALAEEWPILATLEQLIPLKKRWGVSLPALVRHGRRTGLLNESEYQSLRIRLVANGFQRREPDPLRPESPHALVQVIADRIAGGDTLEDLARAAHVFRDEFESTLQRTSE